MASSLFWRIVVLNGKVRLGEGGCVVWFQSHQLVSCGVEACCVAVTYSSSHDGRLYKCGGIRGGRMGGSAVAEQSCMSAYLVQI